MKKNNFLLMICCLIVFATSCKDNEDPKPPDSEPKWTNVGKRFKVLSEKQKNFGDALK
jgi:hypothetical protein